MAWCHQASSHYFNQCWPSLMTSFIWHIQAFLSHISFSAVIFGDDVISCEQLCETEWISRVFIYQTDSFLFGHHYLFLTETVGNIWYMYLEELVQFDIPDHWGMINFIYISFFDSVHQFFYTWTAIMHRTRAVRCQLIQWRDLEFNLLNDGHPGGVSW